VDVHSCPTRAESASSYAGDAGCACSMEIGGCLLELLGHGGDRAALVCADTVAARFSVGWACEKYEADVEFPAQGFELGGRQRSPAQPREQFPSCKVVRIGSGWPAAGKIRGVGAGRSSPSFEAGEDYACPSSMCCSKDVDQLEVEAKTGPWPRHIASARSISRSKLNDRRVLLRLQRRPHWFLR